MRERNRQNGKLTKKEKDADAFETPRGDEFTSSLLSATFALPNPTESEKGAEVLKITV